MAYCGPRGIPLSRFLGREGGPEWLPDDRAAALAWQSHEATRCRNCGTHPDDVEDGRYHAHAEQCKGCQRRESVQEALKDETQRGVFAVALPYSAMDCDRCRPSDDDD